MAEYLLLFSFTGETVRRFVARPSDRAAVVRGLAEPVGGLQSRPGQQEAGVEGASVTTAEIAGHP